MQSADYSVLFLFARSDASSYQGVGPHWVCTRNTITRTNNVVTAGMIRYRMFNLLSVRPREFETMKNPLVFITNR